MTEMEIGKVSDFFAKPVVAGIALTGSLKVGDVIHIKGHTTDLQVTVSSIQIEKQDIEIAKAGEVVGVKVTDRVRPGDTVYLIS
jgi:putative protease